MMRIALLLLMFTSSAIAQDDLVGKFNQYEAEKKDKAVATLCWALIPGGGHFYSESNSGVIYLLVTAVTVVLYAAERSGDETPIWGLLTFAGVRIHDLITSFEAVDKYNTELRSRLGLRMNHTSASLTFRLTLDL